MQKMGRVLPPRYKHSFILPYICICLLDFILYLFRFYIFHSCQSLGVTLFTPTHALKLLPSLFTHPTKTKIHAKTGKQRRECAANYHFSGSITAARLAYQARRRYGVGKCCSALSRVAIVCGALLVRTNSWCIIRPFHKKACSYFLCMWRK